MGKYAKDLNIKENLNRENIQYRKNKKLHGICINNNVKH